MTIGLYACRFMGAKTLLSYAGIDCPVIPVIIFQFRPLSQLYSFFLPGYYTFNSITALFALLEGKINFKKVTTDM